MRRAVTAALAALLIISAAATPAAATFGDQAPDVQIVRYGADGNPSFVVGFENGSESSIRDWANASSSRTLISIDEEADTATVAAPYPHVTGGMFRLDGWVPDIHTGQQLDDLSYITSVAVNHRLAYAEPVSSLATESEFPAPQKVGYTSLNDPERPTAGISFANDTGETTMGEVRGMLGVNQVLGNASGLTGAVVDTGCNVAEPHGRIFGNGTEGSTLRISNASASFLGSGVKTVNESGYDVLSDPNGHGTWTAAALAANPQGTMHDGMAPNATLLCLKALDKDGQGSTSDIAQAIRYAADEGAQVISLSLGSPIYSTAIADAVKYAIDKGSVVLVAAGNSRASRSPGIATPGDVDGVITVGATNYSEQGVDAVGSAYFSQVGPDPSTTDGAAAQSEGASVDVVAPGMSVTARVATTDGYVENSTLSGTSMATPEVAGAVLRAMGANQTLADASPQTVLEAVRSSARPAKNLAAVEAGHGMFNAANLANGTTPATSQEVSMTDPAKQRNQFYKAAYNAAGGPLAGLASRVGA